MKDKHRKGVVPIVAWVIVASLGGISLFGRGALDVVGSGICKIPYISSWDACQPTMFEYVTFLMPWLFLFFALGLGYLIVIKGGFGRK